MQTEICDNCGEEAELWTMTELNYGRGKKMLCPRCYGSGSRDVMLWTIKLQQRLKEDKRSGGGR